MLSARLDAAGPETVHRLKGDLRLISRPSAGRYLTQTGLHKIGAKTMGWATAILGGAVLLGWFLGNESLKAVVPGSDPLKINAAIGFLLCGLALILLAGKNGGRGARVVVAVVSIAVVLLGALTLGEYFLNRDLIIENWGIHPLAGTLATAHPGRMMPTTAFCFVAIGIALVAETRFIGARFASALSAGLSAAMLIIAILALGGLFLEQGFGPKWNLLGMSISGVSAAIGFLLLGAGVLLLLQGKGELGWWLGRGSSAAFVFAILLTVSTTGAAYTFAKKMLATDKSVAHREEVLKEIQRCMTSLVELLDSERVYIIIGDDQLLKDRQQTITDIRETLSKVRKLTSDNPFQGQRMNRIEPAVAERFAWEEEVIAARRAQGMAVATQMISAGTGFRLSDEIRKTFSAMQAEEYRLLKQDRQNSEAAALATFLLLPLGVFLSITTLSLAVSFLNRGLAEETRVQDELRDSERRYRSLFQSNPNPMWIYDCESLRFLAVNDAAVRHYGYSHNEFLSMSILDIRPEEDLAALMENVRATSEPLGKSSEWRHRKKNGELIDVEIVSHRMSWTERPARLVLISDITVRKRAETALRESNERLKKVLEVETVGVMFWDLTSGVLVDANDTFLRLMGYSRREVEVGELTWEKLTPPEYFEASREEVKKFAKTGRVGPYEKEYIRKDGTRQWFVFAGSSLGNNQCVEFCVDVSARKRAEEEIHQLNAELEGRVKQRTAELEAANKELEAFSYTVSHDLRAPLRAVDGFSQAVIEDYGDALPKEGQKYLKTIREGAQRMGVLIDDLLTFSRLSRLPLEKQNINPESLVRDALHDLQSQRNERNIDIHVGELPKCEADPKLLKQVWMNLLSNAIKYTGRRDEARIEIGCKAYSGEPAYFVSDNGTGFDMQYAHKLFGVFQRLHREDEFDGTGVGLAIVQRVVHRHGGRVWAKAEPDQGATFYFTLGTGGTA